jgi:RNA polymerase sigma factor (sigma-70 family)
MSKLSNLTQTAFEGLLIWLDSDRDRAGQRYEYIRRALIKFFAAQGCGHAEDLADETITRVAHKVGTLAGTYEGDPALFFYGVAKNVRREYLKSISRVSVGNTAHIQDRAQHVTAAASAGDAEALLEARSECLAKCLRVLPDEQRELVIKYYENEKSAKIDGRRVLAERHQLSINALRLKACRLRQSLRKCVVKCMTDRF